MAQLEKKVTGRQKLSAALAVAWPVSILIALILQYNSVTAGDTIMAIAVGWPIAVALFLWLAAGGPFRS